MSDGRDRDTVPAPGDLEGRLGQQLGELELACANMYEVLDRVALTVKQIKLAQLTTEHRTHVIHEAKRNDRRWLVDHERRLRALEGLDPAAE